MEANTIHLDPQTLATVETLAQLRGKSKEELIREAVSVFVRVQDGALPRGIGCYRSGRSDISARTKDVLRRAVREGRWP